MFKEGVDSAMEIILYSAITIAALAFLILIIYCFITWKATQETLKGIWDTTQGISSQVQNVSEEASRVIAKSNTIADDLNQKTHQLDGLIQGAKGIGDTVEDFNKSLQHLSDIISKHSKEEQEKAAQAVKWGASFFEYWNKRKTNSN